MAKRNKTGIQDKRGPLQRHIEVLSDSPSPIDSVDPSPEAHIRPFVSGWREKVSLEPFSLQTPEEAKKAAEQFEKKLETLQQQMRIAKSLRRMLEAKKRTGLE